MLFGPCQRIRKHLPIDAVALLILAYLIAETPPPIHLLKACLYAACHEFERQVTLLDRAESDGSLMRAMIDYIATNYRHNVRLTDMAQALGYSYHYLSRAFHKCFALSFSEFLNQYRLDEALIMLIHTDRPIADVALDCGFQSIRSFNDFFKSHVGLSPHQYRRFRPQ